MIFAKDRRLFFTASLP
jgi:hypothetical protein